MRRHQPIDVRTPLSGRSWKFASARSDPGRYSTRKSLTPVAGSDSTKGTASTAHIRFLDEVGNENHDKRMGVQRKHLGWFIDLHFTGEMLPRLRPWLETIPANVVIDHFGRVDASAGPDSEPFRVLCDLAERDNMWVKLSGVDRISAEGYPYADVVPLARRLTEVAPDRLIWGTDWPHTGYFDSERMPDDGLLVDTLALMVPDELVRDRILTVNPNELLRGTADAKETL